MSSNTSNLLNSGICTQKSLASSQFQDWAVQFKEAPGHLHRKIWEWCFITQALSERDLLKSGVSGLGFAVGTEPLASKFCSLGASVMATDVAADIADEKGWVDTNQHASSLESLNSRNLCEPTTFAERCTFRSVDMNHIPDDLGTYDFIWSSCALEHLGSLELGEQFIYNSLKCLKPGGFAVHTTEYNCSSNSDTIKTGGTVLYRKKDIQNIVANLQKEGHLIEMDFATGDMPEDDFIDVPPYKHNPHLKLKFAKYVITSAGLIIQKLAN